MPVNLVSTVIYYGIVAKFKWNVITAIFIQFSATQSLSLSGFLIKRYALENCFKRSFLGTLKKVEMVFEVERDAMESAWAL